MSECACMENEKVTVTVIPASVAGEPVLVLKNSALCMDVKRISIQGNADFHAQFFVGNGLTPMTAKRFVNNSVFPSDLWVFKGFKVDDDVYVRIDEAGVALNIQANWVAGT